MPKAKKNTLAKPKPTGFAIHYHAVSVLLDYIDQHLGDHATKPSQISALEQLIKDYKLQYTKKNFGGIYPYKIKELWNAIIAAVERHKSSIITADTRGDNAVHQMFMLGSALFDQGYLDTVDAASTPVGSSPGVEEDEDEDEEEKEEEEEEDDEPTPQYGRNGRQLRSSSRQPSLQTNTGQKRSNRTDSLKLSTLPGISENEEKNTTKRITRKKQKAKPVVDDIDEPTGDESIDLEIKEEILDNSNKRSKRNRSQTKKHVPTKTQSIEVLGDSEADDQEVEDAGSESEQDGIRREKPEDEEHSSNDEESEPPVKSRTLTKASAKTATKSKRQPPPESGDEYDSAGSGETEGPIQKKTKTTNRGRAATPGPPTRSNNHGSQVDSEEEQTSSEQEEKAEEEDELSNVDADSENHDSAGEATPHASDAEQQEDEEEDDEDEDDDEADHLDDLDTELDEEDAADRESEQSLTVSEPEVGRHTAKQVPHGCMTKPASPAKRPSSEAFDDADQQSDSPTAEKRQRMNDAESLQSGPALMEDETFAPEHDEAESAVASAAQKPAPTKVSRRQSTSINADSLKQAFKDLSASVDNISTRFFRDIGQTAGRAISIAPQPYPALEAVYEHVLGGRQSYVVVAQRLAFSRNFEPADLLRSMIASQILTTILMVDLPWQTAVTAPSSAYMGKCAAERRDDSEQPVRRMLWLASETQIRDEDFLAMTVAPKAQQLAAGILLTLAEHLCQYVGTGTATSDWHAEMYRRLVDACRDALILKSRMVASKLVGRWKWESFNKMRNGQSAYGPREALMVFPEFVLDSRAGVEEDLEIDADLISGAR